MHLTQKKLIKTIHLKSLHLSRISLCWHTFLLLLSDFSSIKMYEYIYLNRFATSGIISIAICRCEAVHFWQIAGINKMRTTTRTGIFWNYNKKCCDFTWLEANLFLFICEKLFVVFFSFFDFPHSPHFHFLQRRQFSLKRIKSRRKHTVRTEIRQVASYGGGAAHVEYLKL